MQYHVRRPCIRLFLISEFTPKSSSEDRDSEPEDKVNVRWHTSCADPVWLSTGVFSCPVRFQHLVLALFSAHLLPCLRLRSSGEGIVLRSVSSGNC